MMKIKLKRIGEKYVSQLLIVSVMFMVTSCEPSQQTETNKDPLPSWNNTDIKHSLLNYINKSSKIIPVEDRIAVFDMDGTIACEYPLWFEMYAAVNGLNQKSEENSSLLRYPEYQFARKLAADPADTSVSNHWVTPSANFVDSMVWKAYSGIAHETYVDSARSYLTKTKDVKFEMPLADMFYQPMIELINYLKKNQFSVYIVSGSVQGVLWSICPKTIGVDRDHLIGTHQVMKLVYQPEFCKSHFIIQKGILQPKNNGNGKDLNIYLHIGKIPVFAFGNTTGDFGMLHLAATSPYPNLELLLNHDDPVREYAYPPYHGKAVPAWRDSLVQNHWEQVNMSTEFRNVWMER